jgi:chorismate dehydratase
VTPAAGPTGPAGPGAAAAAGRPGERRPRVGRIEFINCFPLYLHFEEEFAARGYEADIVWGTPAQLNRLLVDGEIDVALPSSIEYARHAAALTLLPGVSISSFGAVDSIQLFGRVPREQLRSVALSEKSATSVTLLKVLAREWGSAMAFATRIPGQRLADTMEHHDGVLMIGDDALHILRDGVYPCSYDLGEEWRAVTGLPMVYAIATARREFVEERPDAAAAVAAALEASKLRCAARPRDTAAAAALLYDFSQEYLEHYFDTLKFGFTDEYRQGLAEFYRRAAAIGELDDVPGLRRAR